MADYSLDDFLEILEGKKRFPAAQSKPVQVEDRVMVTDSPIVDGPVVKEAIQEKGRGSKNSRGKICQRKLQSCNSGKL
jgi:hypothetical protein